MPVPRTAESQAVLSQLLNEHGLAWDTLLYREVERAGLAATAAPDVYRLAANPQPSESVVDVYGPGYVVQAEQLGPGLAFAESATRNWQDTVELRALRAGRDPAAVEETGPVAVEARLGELLAQGGLMYPVQSVTVQKAWYFTLPEGSVEVRDAT